MTEQPARLQRKARGERPKYFADPAIDKVLSMTMALAGEVAVMRDRLDTLERFLEDGTAVTRTALDSYVPDAAARAERDAWRETFLDVVLRRIHQDLEGLEAESGQGAYETAVEEVVAG